MLKLRLILASLSTAGAITPAAYMATESLYSDINDYDEKAMIENNIRNNSSFLREENEYLYEGKSYRDKDEIIHELMENDPIEEEITSSDPNKILQDISTGKIDDSKLYGTNPKDFVKVSKNFFGKVVLPSCNELSFDNCINSEKTSEERALDSYISPGDTRIKYSYDDIPSHYYDSIEEAEINYANQNYEIGESLFYKYKGNFYNAFNRGDLEKIKSQMTPGYFLDESAGLDFKEVGLINKQKDIAETKSDFFDVLEKKLKGFFDYKLDGVNENVFQSSKGYKVEITSGDWGDFWWREGGDIETNDISIRFGENKSNKKIKGVLTIEVKNAKTARTFDINTFLKNFENVSGWENSIHTNHLWDSNDSRDKYFKTINIEGIGPVRFENTTYDDNGGTGYTHTKVDAIKIGEIEFEDEDLKFNSLNNNFLDEINYDGFFKDFFSGYNDLKKDISLSKWMSLKRDARDQLVNLIKEQISKKISNIIKKTKALKEDYIYIQNNAGNFSLQKSDKLFKQLIKNYNNNESEFPIKEISNEFKASKEEWLNNFYYIDQDNSNTIPLVKMYYVKDKDSNRNNYSDVIGRNLSYTSAGAKQLQSQKENKILYKKYFIYNPFGEELVQTYDEKQSYELLKSKINLDYQYINKNELKYIRNNETDFDKLISTGKYHVFKFKVNNKYIYFNNYKNALNMYENQFNLISGISVKNKKYFKYTTYINNKKYDFYWSDENQLKELVNKIYQLI